MAFRRIEEKALGSEPSGWLMTWCPTMDLVAYVTGENHIAVHRLSWAKLVTFTDAVVPITTLIWSPDGKALASGHEDGHITIYDVEAGEAMVSMRSHTFRITALYWGKWASLGDNDENCTDRANWFLPPLLPPFENSRVASSSFDRHQPSVLISGDSAGSMCIRVSGSFLISHLQICVPADAQRDFTVQIMHITTSSDLSCIYVIAESTGKLATELKESDGFHRIRTTLDGTSISSGAGYLFVLDSSVLMLNATELFQISSHAWTLDCILIALQSSQESMRKHWKEAWDHMASKLQSFEQHLRSNASNSTVESELLTCIASGCASPALQGFLTSLREQGIRRWEKAMDSGCTQIQQQINQRILPAVQALLFCANELLGLSRWEERYSAAGLKEKAFEILANEGEGCLFKASELLSSAQAFHAGMGQFCRWMERMALRLVNDGQSVSIASDDAWAVAKFIKTHLTSNRIAALLEDKTDAERAMKGTGEEGTTPWAAVAWESTRTCALSLSAQVKQVKDAADGALAASKTVVGSRLRVTAAVRVLSAAGTGVRVSLTAFDAPACGSARAPGLSGCYVVLSGVYGDMKLKVLRLVLGDGDGEEEEEEMCVSVVQVSVEEDGAGEQAACVVADVQLYGSDKIAAISRAARAGGEGVEHRGGCPHLILADIDEIDWPSPAASIPAHPDAAAAVHMLALDAAPPQLQVLLS